MARERREMGHSVTENGYIHHGVVDGLPGQRITAQEAEALKAMREPPPSKVAPIEKPVAGDAGTAALILGLQDQITRARGEIHDLRSEFDVFTSTLSKE